MTNIFSLYLTINYQHVIKEKKRKIKIFILKRIMNDDLITFINESCELANEAIRFEEIKSDGTINEDINDVEKVILNYYIDNLILLDDAIFSNKTNRDMELYRNISNDIYFDKEEDDIVNNVCHTSCFTDNFDNENFGEFRVKIFVPKGTPYFNFDNVIFLPRADFMLKEKNDKNYTLHLIKVHRLFSR